MPCCFLSLWALTVSRIKATEVSGTVWDRPWAQNSSLMLMLLVTMALPLLPGATEGGVAVVVEEAGCCCFFLLIFRSFARRFWNQIFTCLSDRLREEASSAFLLMVMYLL